MILQGDTGVGVGQLEGMKVHQGRHEGSHERSFKGYEKIPTSREIVVDFLSLLWYNGKMESASGAKGGARQ